MLKQKLTDIRRTISAALIAAILLSFFYVQSVYAATLTAASVTLSDSRPSQGSVSYAMRWTEATNVTLECITYVFTTTATGSTTPTMTTTTADKGTFTNLTAANWTLDATVNGTIKITNASGENPAGAVITNFDDITNPDSEATFFMKINTYTDDGCSSLNDSSVVAFATTQAVLVSATIDPSLTFAVAGLSAGTNLKGSINVSTGCSDTATAVTFPTAMSADTNYQCGQSLTVSTNGGGGYTVTTRGTHASSDFLKHTGTPATTIADHTGSNASPTAFPTGTGGSGSEAFGYTSDDATLGTGTAGRFGANDVWAGFVNSGTTATEVAYSSGPVASEVTKIGLRIRFTQVTEPGTYQGTLIYICTPVF